LTQRPTDNTKQRVHRFSFSSHHDLRAIPS
jgi:hypothetical protein